MAPADDLEFLLQKLDELEELGHILGVEGSLQQFRGAVRYAKAAWAADLDYRSLEEHGDINDRADALLEKIWCWHERNRSSGTSSSAVDAVARFFNKIKFRTKITSELKELVSEYQLRTVVSSGASGSDKRETRPELEEAYRIVGRDEDVENVIKRIDQLRQQVEEDDNKLRIIPIVGMPGIGKTTVAQMVYGKVEHRFEVRIWVHVSQYFDHKRVLRRMADFLLRVNYFERDRDSMRVDDFLKEQLRGKKYLLVLDDVWNEDQSKWDALKQQLLDISGAQGTVIVTTTSLGVAETMMKAAANSDPPYELQALSAADCLQLFQQSLQEGDEEPVRKTMQNISYGLPLEVFNLTKTWFNKNHYRRGAAISERINICHTSVSSRYAHLPMYLRSCFNFCSSFPEDHIYDMEELGEIWLAQRYAPPSSCWNEAEAAQPELTLYAELWKDCFFRHSTEGKATYKMHYTMRQFAEKNDRSHMLLIVDSKLLKKIFMASFRRMIARTLILLREPGMLLFNHKCKISRIPPHFFTRMNHLCALDLQYTMIKQLPSTMENLLNLRYLNLSGTDIATVPPCIGKLQSLMFVKLVNCKCLTRLSDAVSRLINLQKLDTAGCDFLVHVPNRIDNMKQLRCMNMKDCSSIIQMPCRLGQFTNLRTLPRFVLGGSDGYTIKELQTLRGLDGELRIENLQKVAGGNDAETAELSKKTMLNSLTLQWKWWKHAEEARDTKAIEGVLENLQPNKNLIKLEIISYMGKQFPSWMGEVLPYLSSLQEIKLFNLKGCQALPPLGVLPCLRLAEISGMDAVTKVDDAFYGADGKFPSLQRLTFSQMLNLEKWLDVDRRNMFPLLTNLTFIHCPQMVALEMELPSVTELAMWLNNDLLYNSKRGLKGLARSLKKISISLGEKLLESSECEGLQELQALEEMEISGCQELFNLPRGIRHLNSMKSLTIIRCNKMTASPKWSNDELTSLCSLSINGCNLLPSNSPER